ncbi:nitrogenase cofactor biosynthesis protein NifB [Pleomorphomonas koreensis]|uniref:nitrogenase cofactor biosynthesis protein NifB n=1 Tax=Pleomorphomonas koreensis TaxID=257440 RepID=UPI0004018B7B|nr:nitrogenase cofactor biosynthesis protein NifB [Pleomorphomonas koreensis]
MSSQIVSLDSFVASPSPVRGCASSSCGSSARPADVDPDVWEKIKDHPCYSEEAHHYFARMHVAVAPACNIQCNYCNRKYDCSNESRPGVVSERLTPEEAVRKVVAVAAAVPELSVLGIAGPGDALANWKQTRATFDAVRKVIPDVKFCLSTNGLALPDYADEIAGMAIDHVTITINAVDPEIGAKIYPWIFFDHKRRTGLEAATIFLERQMRGLEMLVARGILVKINSVMIPGINDAHLPKVNRAVRQRGAFLHNIMPLISDPAHGTHFGLTGQRGPTPAELKTLQDQLDGGAKLMRHCRQCRADAIGLLGEDRGQEFTLDRLPEFATCDPAPRQAYRAFVAAERGDRGAARADALRSVSAVADDVLLVAVATKGGARINEHFGHTREFQIYEAGPKGITLVGHRKVDAYCMGGFGEDATLGPTIAALDGIDTVLCAKIGDCPRDALAEAGITVTDAHAYDYIETAIGKLYAERFGRSAAVA